MKVICTNIGPPELGGQLEWIGSAGDYTRTIDTMIKTAYNEDFTTRNREDDGHIYEYYLDAEDREILAQMQIDKFYSGQRQLDIMRKGSKQELDQMNQFIDRCQLWAKGDSNDPFGLEGVEP
jgi:predicted transcriptional regulator